jgi:hypothetical protein
MGHQEMMHECTVLGQHRSLSFMVLKEFKVKNSTKVKARRVFAEK